MSATSIQAGMDTARAGGTAEALATRAENQALAHAYLTRRFPASVAGELAAILGLVEAPARDPGRCACGAELPMAAASSAARKQYATGRCYDCTKARTPKRPKPKPAGLLPTDARLALLAAADGGRLVLDGNGDVRLDGLKVNRRYDEAHRAGWVTRGDEIADRPGWYRIDLTGTGRGILRRYGGGSRG